MTRHFREDDWYCSCGVKDCPELLSIEAARTTTYERLKEVIHAVLDRDGQHGWDETRRLTDVIAPKVWNELHAFPLAKDYGEAQQARAQLLAEQMVRWDEHRGDTGYCPSNDCIAFVLGVDW